MITKCMPNFFYMVIKYNWQFHCSIYAEELLKVEDRYCKFP